MLITEQDAKAVCQKILGLVKADDAQISLNSSAQTHQRFAANTFTTGGASADTSVTLTVWIGKKKGQSRTNDLSESALRTLVEQAEQMARISPVDREYLPSLSAQSYRATGGYTAVTERLTATSRAKAIADIIAAGKKDSLQLAGLYVATDTATASATKNGNFFYDQKSNVSLSTTARTPAGDGSGYFTRSHFDAAKLDTMRIARAAITKALTSRAPQPLAPGAYPVILEAQAVADLVPLLGSSLDARSAEEGRSAFSAPGGKTRLGEKFFDERVNLFSDPQHVEVPAAAATAEGIPAEKLWLVRNGVIETLINSRFWAQQKGKTPTPGPVNLLLTSTTTPVPLEDMIANTERGLLVSRFWYIRPVDQRTLTFTGLTRDGLWWIENGKIKHPVRNFRFNQSVIEMLSAGTLDSIGVPERVSRGEGGGLPLFLPPLKIKRFNFSSQ
ncbi:MAG TPA: TldD/PmbA family protein, partial [Blastocatellia bacterium]|nr:TldD/PmbA family protein [Blastocatellia bacterium]